MTEGRFNALVFCAALAVALFGAFNHAMFCDEMQAWLIARDSATPWAIFTNLRYEGHPALWYLLIWPVAQLTWMPDAMKPVSLLAMLGAVTLFLWYGPWSRLEKLLWPIGYYVLFEYGIKSRNYGIGILLLMLFCVLWPARQRRIIAIALVLGLMANVHVYFAVLAAAGALALLVDRWQSTGWHGLFASLPRDVTACAVLGVLVGIAVLTAAPPAIGDYSEPRPADAMHAALALGDLFWPMMQSYLEGGPSPLALGAELGGIAFVVMCLIGAILQARHAPPALAFLLASLSGLLAFFYLGYPARTQHAGMLLIALTGGIWLQRASGGRHGASVRTAATWRVILICQAAAGLLTVFTHVSMPYSNGRRVADFVRAQGWAGDNIAGIGPWFTTVCGYLQKPACFYADRNRTSSYLVQDGAAQRVNDTSPPDVAALARATDRFEKPMTFIATAWFDNPDAIATMQRHGYRRVASFTGATIENYTVFRRD